MWTLTWYWSARPVSDQQVLCTVLEMYCCYFGWQMTPRPDVDSLPMFPLSQVCIWWHENSVYSFIGGSLESLSVLLLCPKNSGGGGAYESFFCSKINAAWVVWTIIVGGDTQTVLAGDFFWTLSTLRSCGCKTFRFFLAPSHWRFPYTSNLMKLTPSNMICKKNLEVLIYKWSCLVSVIAAYLFYLF